jgi:hypothetical protein
MAFFVFTMVGALFGRLILFYLKRGTLYMATEFSIRVRRHLRGEYPESVHKRIFDVVRFLTNKTQYDIFELRRINHRRRFDVIKSKLDALFLIDEGAEIFFEDLADQVSYVDQKRDIDWQQFFNYVLSKNPIFNHLFGLFSIDLVQKFYRLLPVFMIMGGICWAFIAPHWQNIIFASVLTSGLLVTINLFLDTTRYDSIIAKTFAWSMFLLWSSRSADSFVLDRSNSERQDSYEESELLDSDLQISQAMEETFSLIAQDDDIPELPELPKAA